MFLPGTGVNTLPIQMLTHGTPYFDPGKLDEQNFVALAQRGVAVKALTNSLASTDAVPAHEGYSDHRRALLQGCLHLYALNPAPGVPLHAAELDGASGVRRRA